MTKSFIDFYGVDVSKDWIDIANQGSVIRVKQAKGKINQHIKRYIKSPRQSVVVLESTGGYERLAARLFSEAGVSVHIAHPNRVRDFAKAKGRLAKTDKLDAIVLEDYSKFIDPSIVRPINSKEIMALNDLNSRLIQLKQFHHQESCRIGISSSTPVKKSLKAMLKVTKTQITLIENQMKAIIKRSPELSEKFIRLQTMKGVGPTLALSLIADLPELGQATKKEIAALVGVAPVTQESGKKKGKAFIRHGRHDLRRVLYMGALVAIRHDEKMRDFYNNLINKGKAKKVGIVAVMRKMIVILNAMIEKGENYY